MAGPQRLTEGSDDWSGFLGFDDYVLGLGGADRMSGAGGKDRLYGGAGSDTIHGGDGDDILDGGDDVQLVSVDGDTSSDHLLGEAGNDLLRGKAGDDVLDGGTGADNLFGGEGHDTLFSTSPPAPEGASVSTAVFMVDTLAEVTRRDGGGTMDGGAGNDTIMTSHDFSGTMTIVGGTGTDTLAFGRDANVWRGASPFNNTVDLLTQSGTTVFNSTLVVREIENIDGDGYNDVFRGDHGANVLRGFGGNDRLEGRGGADTLNGGDGTDVADYSSSLAVDIDLARATQLRNHAQGDVLTGIEDVDGSAFADTLRGNSGANYLFGAAGNDRLEGRGGADTLNGGSGLDAASYESSAAAVTVYLDDPTFGAASFAAGGDAAGDTLISIEDLVGSSQADFLVGNSNANRIEGGRGGDALYGGGGDDTLLGGDGNDIIGGGQQNDTIDGGFGNDTLSGEQHVDTVSFQSWDPTGLFSQMGEQIRIELGEGSAQGSAIRTLTNPTTGVVSVAETDTLTGFENVRGSNRAETIVGNGGANVLEGRGGNDVLEGRGGSDIMDGGAGTDTANHGSNAARVVVTLRDNADGSAAEHASAGGRTFALSTDILRNIENVQGSAFNDDITGNSGDNVIDGRGGADVMSGAGGDDTYIVDHAADTIIEVGGGTIDTVVTSVSYVLTTGANVEVMRTSSSQDTTAINLSGNETSNDIFGNNGANVINGGGGTDDLFGGGGQDSFVFSAVLIPTNLGRIQDFNVADDTIRLDDAVFVGLTSGSLGSGQFVVGAAAQDSNDRIIYNSTTGALLFDRDGSGSAAAVQFAEVTPGLALTNLDFQIV